MHFKTLTILVAGIMANGMMATPLTAEEDANLMTLSTEPTEGGSIVQYGEKRSVSPRADCGGWFQPSCPKVCHQTDVNTPECDDDNGGTNDVCNNLLNDLYGNREQVLQTGARQLCFKREDGDTGCCVKWTKDVAGLTKGDLISRAEKIVAQCDVNGISGKYNTWGVREVCLSYCMSVGAGCKDESDFS